jgi:hypothetical protein
MEFCGIGLFLFTDQDTLAESNPLELLWLGGKRKPVKLTG